MSCCTNTYNLGCHNSCNTIEFSEATSTKTLTGILTFAGNNSAVNVPIVSGQAYSLNLAAMDINENATYTIKFYNSNGSPHNITIDEVVYDCFQFKTMIVYSVSNNTSECCPITLTINGNGGATYSIPEDKTLVLLSTDGIIRNFDDDIDPQDATFVSSTGVITFSSVIPAETVIQIIYK